MVIEHSKVSASADKPISGEFVTIDDERFYAIRNVDSMAPFFISVISNVDHWLFVSSNGGLTAGRVSPDTALFPYVTVDKIHDSPLHTGSKTLLRVGPAGRQAGWEPFNREHQWRYSVTRNLYKNLLGNKLCFEEINHDLQLAFRYCWLTSEEFGFARRCELQNLGRAPVQIDMVDGLQNILPAGTPRVAQTNTSNLVDAYKWTEQDESTGLAFFTLYSGISDRAEPCESLRANTVFNLGLEDAKVLLSSDQLDAFRAGARVHQETIRRGVRGAYFVSQHFEIAPSTARQWQIVADVEQTQAEAVALQRRLADRPSVELAIEQSIERGSDDLARIMGSADGFQATADERISAHHNANVLFNVLRGGIFRNQYMVSLEKFRKTIRHFNREVYERNREALEDLPEQAVFSDLLTEIQQMGDLQLERLCREYMPVSFARRHGDPSRPWNQFAIAVRDQSGNDTLAYQGNWRDIFQNWEALALSYPDFAENMVAKFVNASTIDGYNPYRITNDGIDWEIEDPDDPWSYIGYWGDHQIIYLQKLLELSAAYHPTRISELLHMPVFSYANVPYRIKPFDALLDNPKRTVEFDDALADEISRRVAAIGADGRLILDANGSVYRVNLLEKLLVPLLAKLANLVIDGGIWMNTQRPEWNDANNALVGHGLSMVTLCYLQRYMRFLQQILGHESGDVTLSGPVSAWLDESATVLAEMQSSLGNGPLAAADRLRYLTGLGEAAGRYRRTVYEHGSFSLTRNHAIDSIRVLLDHALAAVNHSLTTNRREDGLYHAYNLMVARPDGIEIETLYPMLEGQVAALSAGALSPREVADVVEALFQSDVYRPDQKSFMLYPDRALPPFLEKNRIDRHRVEAIPLLNTMLRRNDQRLISRDIRGDHRFNADLSNVGALDASLDALFDDYGSEVEHARPAIRNLYEDVFNHRAFTGRSGTMFGFEGLGCIYWHMVAKLQLAVQENFFAALESGAEDAETARLAELYYRIQAGLGFNKTPWEYGAFPIDPYSHTPRHAGARQPGMTGQVKEEILCRYGELGVRVVGGCVLFRPALLRAEEFRGRPTAFRFLDIDGNWQSLPVPARGLAFTYCQVPIIYRLDDNEAPGLRVTLDDDAEVWLPESGLSESQSADLFSRNGRIRKIELLVGSHQLLS